MHNPPTCNYYLGWNVLNQHQQHRVAHSVWGLGLTLLSALARRGTKVYQALLNNQKEDIRKEEGHIE
jgi:hypothetical protein